MILILADECVLYFRHYRDAFAEMGWQLICIGDDDAPRSGALDIEVYLKCVESGAILVTGNAKDFRALERKMKHNVAIFGVKQFLSERDAIRVIDYVLRKLGHEQCRGRYVSLAQALNETK
jgi:hypothetical protein